MKVDTVLLSTTPNERYYSFWNQLAYIYKTRFEIDPHLVFLGTEEQLAVCGLSEKYGTIHRLDQIEGPRTDWTATWAIFFLSTLVDPDSTCLTIGIDQVPLSRRWLDLGDVDPEAYYLGLSRAYYGGDWREYAEAKVPSSWHIAKASTIGRIYGFDSSWKEEILKLDGIQDLHCSWGGPDQHEPGGQKWGIDEAYSTRKLRETDVKVVDLWVNQHLPRLHPHHLLSGNYNRADIGKGFYMEGHCPKPDTGHARRCRDLFLRLVSDTEFPPCKEGRILVTSNSTRKNVLVIGNAPSAAVSGLGQEINEYDGDIVRFNLTCLSGGCPEKLGTRTDIWSVGASVIEAGYGLVLGAREVLCPIPASYSERAADTVARMKKAGWDVVNTRPEVFYRALEEVNRMRSRPGGCEIISTGIAALAHFLDQGYKIDIHGFGFFNKLLRHHYWEARGPECYHDGDAEKMWVETKMQEFPLREWKPESLSSRVQLPDLLRSGSKVIELGVAAGDYATELCSHPNIQDYIGVDRWAGDRGHGTEEMERARSRIIACQGRISVTGKVRPFRLIQSSFEDALPLLKDEAPDMVYIDGYAHTGQEDGKTIRDWWPVVAPGGILAGHDYAPEWPKTVEQVDKFVEEMGLELRIVSGYERFPSWWVRKVVDNEG